MKTDLFSASEQSVLFLKEIDAMRHQARRWRLVAILAVLGVLGLLLGGARFVDAPDEVEAKRFSLRDQDGTERACLETDEQGDPSLTFFDARARRRMTLQMRPDGDALLSYIDEGGKTRIQLGMISKSDEAILALLNPDGRPTLMMSTNKEGQPELNFGDDLGGLRLAINLKNNRPSLYFYGPKEKDQAVPAALGVTLDVQEGIPSLYLLDRDNKLLLQVPQSQK